MTEEASRGRWTLDADAVRQLGAAVLTAQMFETLFVLVARSALKWPLARDFDEIAPFGKQAFKQPVAALVKELSSASQIDPDLADRVNAWVENRHALVHRHLLENVEKSDAEYWETMKALSKLVFTESAELCGVFIALFMPYLAKMSQTEQWTHDNSDSISAFVRYAEGVRASLRTSGQGHG